MAKTQKRKYYKKIIKQSTCTLTKLILTENGSLTSENSYDSISQPNIKPPFGTQHPKILQRPAELFCVPAAAHFLLIKFK